MKIKRLLLPTVPIALITLSSFASAESFSYRYPLDGVLSQSNSPTEDGIEDVEEDFSDSSCYDPENLNTIGTEAPCEGMLIVDEDMLKQASENQTYTISHETGIYTFGDSEFNVFTGQVKDMSRLFYGHTSFNEDIGYWDTSNTINMYKIFYNTSFNQYIGNWDTSSANNISQMFSNTPFNQYIGDWDTSSVINMRGIFQNAREFNQDIGRWDTSNVTDMSYVFAAAMNFNQDISQWDTSKATKMSVMFGSAYNFNQDIGGWDTGSSNEMNSMFQYATSFNQDISGWDTSQLTSAPRMLDGAISFNYDLDSWCVSNINSAPTDFRNGNTNDWKSPVWGTCP